MISEDYALQLCKGPLLTIDLDPDTTCCLDINTFFLLMQAKLISLMDDWRSLLGYKKQVLHFLHNEFPFYSLTIN